MALTALEKIKVTGQLTAALGELNTAANAIAKVKAAKAVTELLARLGVGQAQAEPEKIRNFGWDSVKLADLTYDQLDTLRKQVESEHVNPKDSEGRYVENGKRTIYVYDAKGRKKLDALSWAVTHKLKDDKRANAEQQQAQQQPETEPQQAKVESIEILISNMLSDEGLKNQLSKVPESTLRAFVYGLFDGGHISVGGLKIVSHNNNDRTGENPSWTANSKAEFARFDLLKAVKSPVGDFYEISSDLGQSIWRFAANPKNQDAGGSVGGDRAKTLTPDNSDETAEYRKVAEHVNNLYQDTSIDELKKRRDALEAERKQMMLDVARARAAGRGNRTAVNVKEGAAERFAVIIEKLDIAIAEKEKQKAPDPASLAEVASNPEPDKPEQPQHQIIEYTTKRGKVLRGVIRTDLTYAQAKAIDEYTWKMNGGWFIRERHLSDLPASAVGQPVQQVEKAVKVEPTPEELAAKELAKRQERANKLLEAGQNVIDRADSVINQDRKTNTHRRASMAAGVIQREEGNRALGVTMQNIANGILDGEVQHLSGITAKAQLESLERVLRMARYEREKGLNHQQRIELKDMPFDKADADNARMPQIKLRNHGQFVRVVEEKAIRGYKKFLSSAQYWGERPLSLDEYSEVVKFTDADSMVVDWLMTDNADAIKRLNKLGITNNEQLRAALNEYLSYRGEKRAENPIKKLERELIGKKVGIDFFPTPSAQAQKMIALAGIKHGDRVLEPSAGNGNIADAAAAAGAVVDVVEISPQLQDILKAKGYNLVDTDFMDYQPEQPYDAIVMNPPFSNRLDAAHIMRAYEMVKPGGSLVAIAGEGVFFGSDKKAVEFRDWLEKVGATDDKLDAGTFKDASLLATTGANARMIVIRK